MRCEAVSVSSFLRRPCTGHLVAIGFRHSTGDFWDARPRPVSTPVATWWFSRTWLATCACAGSASAGPPSALWRRAPTPVQCLQLEAPSRTPLLDLLGGRPSVGVSLVGSLPAWGLLLLGPPGAWVRPRDAGEMSEGGFRGLPARQGASGAQ